MSDWQDAFHEKVEAERRSRSHPIIFYKLMGEMVFTPAFNEISGQGAAVPVLIHVLFRQPFPPSAKERKKLEKAGVWPSKPKMFSFPYREARHHGLSEKGLVAGLAALHRVGHIDRIKPGSAKRGKFAEYILSERWRKWGRKDFQELPWEKATPVGVNDTGGTGRFLPRRIGKKGAHKSFLAAKSAATEKQTTAEIAATPTPLAAKSAVNTPPIGVPVAAKCAVFLSLPSSDVDPWEVKKDRRKTRTLNRRSKDAAAQIRRDDAQPPIPCIKVKLNDLRKQVDELLVRNLNGGVLNTPFAVSVLWDLYMDRIDAEKARFSLKSYFTDSIIMGLFTLIGYTTRPKIGPVAIQTWPDQGKVLDLCDKLTLDAINQFGSGGDHPHPEMETARNLADIISRAVGSRATN